MGHKEKMDRIIIRRGHNITEVEIHPVKDKVSKIQLMFLIFGMVGLVISINQFLSNDKLAVKIFLAVWGAIWIFFLFKVWTSLKWRRFGQEIIKITENELSIIEKAPFDTIVHKFKMKEFTISINSLTTQPGKDFFEPHPGSLKIKSLNGLKLKSFGRYLNDEEAEIIIQEIQNIGLKFTKDDGTVVKSKETKEVNTKKEELRKFQWKTFLIILIPVFIYTYSQYKNDIDKYENLKLNGEVTQVVAEFQENWDVDYYYYYFLTNTGNKIEHQGKVKNKVRFGNYYKNLKVIYLPTNPSVYMEYPHFKNYSVEYKVFFYLILLTFVLSFMGSGIVSMTFFLAKRKGEITSHNNI